MSKVVIPYLSPLGFNRSDYSYDLIASQRSKVLHEVRLVSGIPELVRRFNPETVYKLVTSPEGGKLLKDSAGNIKGVFYKDGKILEHAKFKAVSPSLIQAAKAAGAQILLVSIAMQLNRIEQEISKVRVDLHNDRISEVHAGLNLYDQALLAKKQAVKQELFCNALQSLNVGIEKTIKALKVQIEEAPEATVGFWDNWWTNKSVFAQEKLGLAEESFYTCVLGVKTISDCYVALEEPNVAAYVLSDSVRKILDCRVDLAFQKSRLIPARENVFPEHVWGGFLDAAPEVLKTTKDCKIITEDKVKYIEIEFKPHELIGGVYERL
ncbi:hypothetical protein [Maridesulfovibrio sp. FT414]|uniref:hypothetical protein n=1 Tax=Maridesulfovibrio sp. FT414 TaxID=2979469 RepID=UPI003D8029C1